MKYPSGEKVRLGDKVRLRDGTEGLVVCSIDTREYTAAYPKEQWEYLQRGVLVDFSKHGLIHYEQPEPDLQLVDRAAA